MMNVLGDAFLMGCEIIYAYSIFQQIFSCKYFVFEMCLYFFVFFFIQIQTKCKAAHVIIFQMPNKAVTNTYTYIYMCQKK